MARREPECTSREEARAAADEREGRTEPERMGCSKKKKEEKKDGGDGSETAVGELMTEEATTKRRNAHAGVRGR